MSIEKEEFRELSPTIYGIEQEYSVTADIGKGITHEIVGQCHSEDYKLGLYVQPKQSSLQLVTAAQYDDALSSLDIYRNKVGMLSNGGRFYIDPSGPEYCTPETTTAAEATLRTFDGDRIMFGIMRYLQEKKIINSFQLNRRIVDHNRSSRGVHLNTATILERNPDVTVRQVLGTLNVAKGSMFGSGGLLVNKDGVTEYHHSPRLSLTNKTGLTPASYTDRSLVRYPFNEDVDCRRVETITSDALNFAWPLRASLVATNSLLKLCEQDRVLDELPRLILPMSSALEVGLHGNDTTVHVMMNETDKFIYPSELMTIFAERALEEDERSGMLDEESRQVLGEIIETADLLRSNPDKTVQRIESIARYHFMNRKMDEFGVGLDSKKLCQFDHYWDKIGNGIAESLREKRGWGWHGFKEADSKIRRPKKMNTPPKDTRAHVRGKLIKDSKGSNDSQWYDIEFFLEDEFCFNAALHPLDTEIPELE